MLHTMMNFPLTLMGILQHASLVHSKTEVVSCLPNLSLHRYTVGDLSARVWRLAAALRQIGLQPGERVATLMWNHYAHLEAYFAIPAMGGVFNTLNLRLHPEDIAYIANHAGARILIVDDVLLPLYLQFCHLTHFEQVIVVPLSGQPVSDQSMKSLKVRACSVSVRMPFPPLMAKADKYSISRWIGSTRSSLREANATWRHPGMTSVPCRGLEERLE